MTYESRTHIAFIDRVLGHFSFSPLKLMLEDFQRTTLESEAPYT